MLELIDIKKSYKTADFTQTALDGVSIAFRDNEFAAVLGPSGSGKTTMLNIIGGLDHYDSGDLVIDNISTKKYRARNWDTYRNNRIGFVFQSYNLIPHQSVLANVELALTLSGVSKHERRARAKQALEEVGLKDHIKKRPNQLSGGQMQRVAIARALINDPEILLADEPTGALDTHTSQQVMDLLTQIAKDRLVIMVTHNPDLAEKYANRTIHLQDGQVTSDSRPFDPAEEEWREGRKAKKARMSFLTAVALSFSNLMTKKGRTFVTALAGSIGIIGIAAIMALANGIDAYIKNTEEETLSIYPLSIQSSGFDLSSMFGGGRGGGGNRGEDIPGTVRETRIVENMFSRRSKNDLASLKAYFDTHQDEIGPYVNSIQYTYDITPQIYLADTSSDLHQVNPDGVLSSYGLGAGSGMSAMMGGMSGMSAMNAFSEMPGDRKMFEYQYEVVAGRWPEKYNEVVLVLSDRGRILDFQLYAMGIRDRAELKSMMEAFMNKTEADMEINDEGGRYSFDELMAPEFKVINPADKYQYDATYDVWVDKSGDKSHMKSLVDKGLTLRIVGIVQPDPDASATSLSSGINYTPELIHYLMEQAAGSELVKEQLKHPTINVITGKTFAEEQAEEGPRFDFSKLITVDRNALRKAFNFNMSGLDLSGLDLSSMDMSGLDMPDFDINELTTAIAGSISISTGDMTSVMGDIMLDFFTNLPPGMTDPNDISAAFSAYLASPAVQAKIAGELAGMIDTSAVQTQVMEALQAYMMTVMQSYMSQMMGQMMTAALAQIPAQMQGFNPNAFAKVFQINMGEEEILDLMTSVMNPIESTFERNLNILGYADPAAPSQINIYPRDFESKQRVLGILNDYNDRMEAAGKDDKIVRYTDIVGAMMSSVTSIVDMVSFALIAFVSISLVVSSIMIGVITYISVLERKKEIGILRAIGASKRDIRRVFNAETLIVGFVAGLLGVIVTLIICVVANVILYNRFAIENLAQLPMSTAIALIGVSMFLTFIAGLFPSSAAARKDPVEALRSE